MKSSTAIIRITAPIVNMQMRICSVRLRFAIRHLLHDEIRMHLAPQAFHSINAVTFAAALPAGVALQRGNAVISYILNVSNMPDPAEIAVI